MLTELRISNFGVIEQLTIEFHPGFTVLTGETGAGKSLLIDALALLVGGRASADQIRAGADEAHLEAVFSLAPDHALIEALRREDVLDDRGGDLIVHRVVAASGRNRNYVNSNPVPLRLLERLGGTLVDIHGQHDQQSLLAPRMQLDALDAFGQLRDLRTRHERAYESWTRQREALDALQQELAARRQREDYMRYQLQEITAIHPEMGEDESLDVDRRRLANAQRLRELAQHVHERLYGEDRSVLKTLGAVKGSLEELTSMDPETGAWTPFLDDATIQLRELAGLARDYEQRIEDDPGRLEQVEQRLNELERLKKKYGASLPAILEQAESLRRELNDLETADDQLADRARLSDEAERQVRGVGAELSRARTQTAQRLQQQVARELSALRMDRTRFEVRVEQRPDGAIGPTGRDEVQFMLSANPGEPLRPLARVASGGELSRVMLALKTILAGTDGVPILIFDEIDAGVGGAVAELMGSRLRALGGHHQVLCVTHWPQVASQSHRHYLIEKSVKRQRTTTRVRELKGDAREAEIARMVGGVNVTQTVRAAAAEMMGSAKDSERGAGAGG